MNSLMKVQREVRSKDVEYKESNVKIPRSQNANQDSKCFAFYVPYPMFCVPCSIRPRRRGEIPISDPAVNRALAKKRPARPSIWASYPRLHILERPIALDWYHSVLVSLVSCDPLKGMVAWVKLPWQPFVPYERIAPSISTRP